MEIEIVFSTDRDDPNGSNLLKDLQVELEALEIGNVRAQKEKPKDGDLVIDWIFIALILGIIASITTIISDTTNIIRNIIDISKEVRSRYALTNGIDIDEVPKINISITQNNTNYNILVPSSKKEEDSFFEQIRAAKV